MTGVLRLTLPDWITAHRAGRLTAVPGKAGVTAEQMEISLLEMSVELRI